MNGKIEIMPVTEEMIPWIAAAEAMIFSDAWSEKALSEQLDKSQSFFYGLTVDRIPAGYMIGDLIFGEFVIYRVAVLPDFRRNGYGRMLLQNSIQTAGRENCFAATLEVRSSNTPAIRLYELCGFKKVGIRKNFYSHPTEDAFIMNLGINEEKNENSCY